MARDEVEHRRVDQGDVRDQQALAASDDDQVRPAVDDAARFARLARQKALLRRRLLLWSRLHELFHYWHVLHKPFAVVMYLFMVVHVAVALATGYAWGAPS